MPGLKATDPIVMAQATINLPRKIQEYVSAIQEDYEGFTKAQEEQVGLYNLLIGKRTAFGKLTTELAESELREAGKGNSTDTDSELSTIKNYLKDIADRILQKDESKRKQEYHLGNIDISLKNLDKAQTEIGKFRDEFYRLQQEAIGTGYDMVLGELDEGLNELKQRRADYQSKISRKLEEVKAAQEELVKTGEEKARSEESGEKEE